MAYFSGDLKLLLLCSDPLFFNLLVYLSDINTDTPHSLVCLICIFSSLNYNISVSLCFRCVSYKQLGFNTFSIWPALSFNWKILLIVISDIFGFNSTTLFCAVHLLHFFCSFFLFSCKRFGLRFVFCFCCFSVLTYESITAHKLYSLCPP